METLSPTRCVACDMPGEPLCAACAEALPFIDLNHACPRCGAPYGRVLCTECPQPGSEEVLAHPEEAFPFSQARCALSFEGKARKLIRTYKDDDELRLDATIASLMCAAMRGRVLGRNLGEASAELWAMEERRRQEVGGDLDGALQENCDSEPFPEQNGKKYPDLAAILAENDGFGAFRRAKRCTIAKNVHDPHDLDDWTQWTGALAYVPASPEAVLRRDFDHMERIARICARRTGLPLLETLVATRGSHDQRALDRTQRRANRRGSFMLSTVDMHIPACVVLIDDVFTTGATLSAATEVLLEAGAREVRVVTCCRVW